MQRPDQPLDLHFPKAGLNLVSAFSRQPARPLACDSNHYARTCPVGVNVRAFDVRQGRVRGGSRPGLSRGSPAPGDQVNDTTWVVQEVTTFTTIGTSPYSDILADLQGYYALDENLLDTSGHGRHLTADAPPAVTYTTGKIEEALATGQGYIKPQGGVTNQAVSLSAWFFATSGTGAGGGTGFGRGTEVGAALRLVYRGNGANGGIAVRDRTGADVIAATFNLTFGTWNFAVMTYNFNTTVVKLFVNGTLVGSGTFTSAANWSALTYGINTAGADFTSPIDEVGVFSRPLSAAQVTLLYNSGSGVNPVSAMQLSQSGRIVRLVAVSQGVVKVANPGDTSWTSVTNNTGETPALNYSGLVYSSPNNQLLFFVDGINYVYYAPETNSLELWSGDVTAGTLPVDDEGNYARLICTWRGRTVLSGLLKEPQNIFMSRVSDPFDWDYAPASPSPAQAVALNLSSLGLIGDGVTALIPYTDDVLVVGCDHSIFLIRGDPQAGGQVDRVTDAIGMAWATGWCKGPDGTIYFISNRCGIYSMIPGSQPIRISQAIEPLLQAIDMGRNVFTMTWDDQAQGFHLFVTWADEPLATTHYFFESRTGAWWQTVFADTDHNPLCTTTFDGNEPGDRRVLIGCWDGYVRTLDPDAEDDDGTDIESEVWIGPLLTPVFDEMTLKEIQGVMGDDSGTVTCAVYVGSTAESALTSEGVFTTEFEAGRNTTDTPRASGHAIYLGLSSTEQWSMEAVRIVQVTRGKVSRREYK